ncbi:MAG: OmpA family protein [Myxococcales bacterium]|nr:OmpA family protein [Myxococcales bacterium]
MILTAASLWLAASSAHAQDSRAYPFDVERFRPVVDPFGYAVTESSTTLDNLQVGVGVWGNYSEDSLILVTAQGNRLVGPAPVSPDGLLDRRTMLDLQLGLGLGGVFGIVVDAPLIVWQQGFEPTSAQSEASTTDLLTSGPGDLRVTPKLVVVDVNEGAHVGLALYATGTIPTGSTRSFIGEGEPTVSPGLAFELATDSIRDGAYLARGALNLGARIKGADELLGREFGPELFYRGALSAKPTGGFELGVDIAGTASTTELEDLPLEILPWARLHGLEVASFTAGGGIGLSDGTGAPVFRLFAGLTIAPSFDPLTLDRDGDTVPNRFDQCISVPEDLDGFQDQDGCPDDDNDADGVADSDDSCPNQPEDLDQFEDADGCPDPDNDGDGIVDSQDSCVTVPEDADGFQDLDGCPDDDNDGDGILDEVDRCRNAAETVNGHEDEDGCPDEKPFIDTDGDGYEDANDTCPEEAEDVDGWQDDDGCPDDDNDLDQIPDTVDQCPFEAETANGHLDEDGCPDTAPSRVIIEKEKIVITEKVFFEYGKAVIDGMSFSLLQEVADVINDNPRLTLVQVEGHTDSDGGDSYNLRLSQARALAVVEFLVGAGVSQSRVQAKGFGESLPIASNDTTAGKAQNRRVEFTILAQE